MTKNKKIQPWVVIVIGNIVAVTLAIIILIAGIAGFAIARITYVPVYTATAIVNVTVKDDIEASYEAVERVAEELTSTSELDFLSKYWGVAEFSGTIDAEVIPDTTLIEVTVKGDDPEEVDGVLHYVTQMRPNWFYGFTTSFHNVDITIAEEPSGAQLEPEHNTILSVVIPGTLLIIVMSACLIFNVVAIVSIKRKTVQNKAS